MVHTDGDANDINGYSVDEKDMKDIVSRDVVAEGIAFKSRTIFIIGPQKHFRLILNYPAAVGFNTAEVLRAMDSLQTAYQARFDPPLQYQSSLR